MSSSIINKNHSNTIISSNHHDNQEDDAVSESGWTEYLEDFSCSNNYGSSLISNPSLVSDAAWNGNTSDNNNSLRRLNVKNSKRNINNYCKKFSSRDDDLEDTASSPVNSPKVSNLKQMEVNYTRIDDVAPSNGLEKQAVSNNYFLQLGREDKNAKHFTDNRNIDQYVDLKKRGLCLVPMSVLMNYLG